MTDNGSDTNKSALLLLGKKAKGDGVEGEEEAQYIDLVLKCLDGGFEREGRGGAVTRSIFGHSSRYSLRDGTLPVLTTKKVFTRGIVEELLWILRGSTDARKLAAKKVHIWDGHTSSDHHKTCRLDKAYQPGDTGPLYGFQWRHAGASYRGMEDDYSGEGVDQIKDVIRSLREAPGSRRHVVCSWAPAQLSQMVLPPCHCLFQFYVDEEGLSCQLYQRSADVALGVPFNITSYALLTHIVARAVGVSAKEFIHVLGDAHVYRGHEGGLREQASRPIAQWPFPKVEIDSEWDGDVDSLEESHIRIKGYKSWPPIKFPLVV